MTESPTPEDLKPDFAGQQPGGSGGFTLDTSGDIELPHGDGTRLLTWTWPDLSPFAQGYLEAAFASGVRQCDRCQGNGELVENWDRYLDPGNRDPGDEGLTDCPDCDGRGEFTLGGFSDLAPATLAAMLRDCEAMTSPPHVFRYDKETGAKNWRMRQEGWPFYSGGPSLREAFPPLTLSLGEDGLIYARAAS